MHAYSRGFQRKLRRFVFPYGRRPLLDNVSKRARYYITYGRPGLVERIRGAIRNVPKPENVPVYVPPPHFHYIDTLPYPRRVFIALLYLSVCYTKEPAPPRHGIIL